MGVARLSAGMSEQDHARIGGLFAPLFVCLHCGPTNHVVEAGWGEVVCCRCNGQLARELSMPRLDTYQSDAS